jgi:hypothetical protein
VFGDPDASAGASAQSRAQHGRAITVRLVVDGRIASDERLTLNFGPDYAPPRCWLSAGACRVRQSEFIAIRYPCLHRAFINARGPAPFVTGRLGTMAEGYCVKDKKKVVIQNAEKIIMKNGKPATQGICPDCGGKVFRIGG